MEYYKLNLNECVFWQKDGNKYIRKPFQSNEHFGLDYIFLKKISDNKYEEMITKQVMEFDNEKCINLKGTNIPLSNITPISCLEINLIYLKIKNNNLKNKYFDILDSLFIINNRCQKKYEAGLSLKKIINKKILK